MHTVSPCGLINDFNIFVQSNPSFFIFVKTFIPDSALCLNITEAGGGHDFEP